MVRHATDQIFALFPPSRAQKLSAQVRQDIEIYLHAVHIHVVALTDNLAWAYVHRHEINSLLAKQTRVGLFMKSTWKRLPRPLEDYVRSARVHSWYTENAKVFRDALAHKVPPYIPPAALTMAQSDRAKMLLAEIDSSAASGDWDRWRMAIDEYGEIGGACFTYAHSVVRPPDARYLHVQVLSDVGLAIELCDLFLKHWNDPPRMSESKPADRIRVDVQITNAPGGVAAYATAVDVSTNRILSRACVSASWEDIADAAALNVPEVTGQGLADQARATALALAKRLMSAEE